MQKQLMTYPEWSPKKSSTYRKVKQYIITNKIRASFHCKGQKSASGKMDQQWRDGGPVFLRCPKILNHLSLIPIFNSSEVIPWMREWVTWSLCLSLHYNKAKMYNQMMKIVWREGGGVWTMIVELCASAKWFILNFDLFNLNNPRNSLKCEV